MAEISKRELDEIKEKGMRLHKRLASMKEEMKESLAYVRQSVEVGVASFGSAWALAKWGGPEMQVTFVGMPVELLGSVLLHGVGFAGVLDGYAEDAHNIADGLLSTFLVKKGLQMGGLKTSTQGYVVSGSTVAGALPAGSKLGPLTPAEMAAAIAG